MSKENRNEGRRFFALNNWTAMCGTILVTFSLAAMLVGIAWAAWGRDKVDARIETKVFPIDARVSILETYIPQIEEALIRNAAEHQVIMTQAQRTNAERTYQDMRRSRMRIEKK